VPKSKIGTMQLPNIMYDYFLNHELGLSLLRYHDIHFIARQLAARWLIGFTIHHFSSGLYKSQGNYYNFVSN
jgi:hypothetical protein